MKASKGHVKVTIQGHISYPPQHLLSLCHDMMTLQYVRVENVIVQKLWQVLPVLTVWLDSHIVFFCICSQKILKLKHLKTERIITLEWLQHNTQYCSDGVGQ